MIKVCNCYHCTIAREQAKDRDDAALNAVLKAYGKVTAEGVNPKDAAGQKKTPLRFLPLTALALAARAMEVGAKKYGPFNWRSGPKLKRTVYLEAALRHIMSDLDGEEVDPETGVPHVAHAIAGLMILLDARSLGRLTDDRPVPGVGPDVMRALAAEDERKLLSGGSSSSPAGGSKEPPDLYRL